MTFNGSLLEDLDQAHRNANALVYAGASKSWVESAGSFAGYWKDSAELGSSSAAYQTITSATGTTPTSVPVTSTFGAYSRIPGDVKTEATNAGSRYASTSYLAGSSYAGMPIGVPLGLLSGVFRTQQLLPLSQMGEMVLQITLAQPGEAIYDPANNTTSTYSLNDIWLEADLVTPNYLYGQMLNMICQDENEPGIVVPIETTIVSQGQSVASTSDNSIVTSRATNNLRKVVVTSCPTDALTAFNYPSVSCFPNANFNQAQWRIGSLYFPSQPANSLARAFWMSVGSFNNSEPLNVYDGAINWNTYGLTTTYSGTGTGLSPAASAGTVYNPGVGNTAQLAYNDKFVLAYNFDNFKGGETLDADGVSILGQSKINWTCATPIACC